MAVTRVVLNVSMTMKNSSARSFVEERS